MLQELKELNYYSDDHPFLNETTEFYLSKDEDSKVREVTNIDKSNFKLF